MTQTYLDEAWFESQASELANLRVKLQENLDIVAVAAGQVPDLVAQIQRLDEREQVVYQDLEALRRQAIADVQDVTRDSTDLLGKRMQSLLQALAEEAHTRDTAAGHLAEQLTQRLTSHHEDLSGQFKQQVQATLDTIPASMKAVETLGQEVREELKHRLNHLHEHSESRERGLLDTLSGLEGDLRHQATAIKDQLTQQIQTVLDTVPSTVQSLEARGEALRKDVQERLTLLNSQSDEQNRLVKQSLERLETSQQERLTLVGGEWETRARAVENQVKETGEAVTQRVSQIEERLSQIAAQLSRVSDEQRKLAEHIASMEKEATRVTEVLETVEARLVGWHSETERYETATQQSFKLLEGALAAQGSQHEEKLKRLQQALDEHGRQVRQSFDELETGQRTMDGRLREQVERLNSGLSAANIRVDALESDARDVRSELAKVSTRLLGFLRWFGRAGAWARLNSKPDE